MVPHENVTTGLELPGFRVKRNLGVVRGIVVRSRFIFGTLGASKHCEQTREQAFDIMIQHANELGADAILCARYDATEVMQGITEVLAYGTAVTLERVEK